MKKVVISAAPLPARIFPKSSSVTVGTSSNSSSRTLRVVVVIAVTIIWSVIKVDIKRSSNTSSNEISSRSGTTYER